MKLIKTFAIAALIFVASNTLSAQTVSSKWPALNTYEQVITRINNGVEHANPNVISGFAGTLNHFAQELTATAIPNAFKTSQIQEAVAKLQAQSLKLSTMVDGKQSDAALKPVFLETYATYQQLLGYMSKVK